MNKSERIAEKIISIAYKEGGTLEKKHLDDELIRISDHNVDNILYEYGEFIDVELGNGRFMTCYKLNSNGYELARNGYFHGKEKEKKRALIRDIVAIATASISLIISIFTCITK